MTTTLPSSSNDTNTDPLPFKIQDSVLGRGATCIVKRAVNTLTGERIAAKEMELNRWSDCYEREVHVLKLLRHKNIIRFYGHTTIENTGVIFVELVRTSLDDVLDFVGFLEEDEAIDVTLEIVEGLQHMHERGIVHSDIKPENVSYNLLTCCVKLFDMGFSEQFPSPDSKTDAARCTPLFAAPEKLSGKMHNPFLADTWALGITFHMMLTGTTPFDDASNIQELMALHEKGSSSGSSVEIPASVSQSVGCVLSGMLRWCPEKRWSLKKIKEKLVQLSIIRNAKSI